MVVVSNVSDFKIDPASKEDFKKLKFSKEGNEELEGKIKVNFQIKLDLFRIFYKPKTFRFSSKRNYDFP